MSGLTKLALRNRSVVALVVVAVIIAGAYALPSLQKELIPDLNFPYLVVLTVEPGASAVDVERGVTVPIEQAVKSTGAVKETSSYSNEGMSIVIVQYEFGTDMKARQSEVQQNLARVQAVLPQGTQPPTVELFNFAELPVTQLAVTSSLTPEQLQPVLDTKIVPRLQEIPGVQDVALSGLTQRELRIELKPKRLIRSGVSPTQIITAVQAANLTTAAGTVTAGSLVYPVTVGSSTETVEAFKKLVIPPAGTSAATGAGATTGAAALGGGAVSASSPSTGTRPVTLGQIARVSIAEVPPTAITRTNGEPSVGIAISKARSGNTVDIAKAVEEQLPAIRDDLKGQANVNVVVDQSIFITESLSSTWREGLVGALFAVLVIWFFLRSWRSTAIAGISIPLSVLGALIILWARGNSLNMLTLGGLTIAIGRVIDDSIVVIENTHRHLQEGDDVHTAAYTATREVATAITASTLTTVAVFLPLGFIQGLSSEFFRPFALTVTFALLASLLVALTVIPVMATWLLSKKHVGHRDPGKLTRLQRWYVPSLKLAMGHRVVTLVLAVAIFVGVMFFGPYLKTNLFDNSAQNSMSITEQMPPGTGLDATSTAAEQIEAVLDDTPGVEIYQVTIGSTGSLFGPGGGTNASSSQAVFTITTDPDMDKAAIIADVRKRTAGLDNVGTLAITGEDASMGGNSDIEVRVTADDPAVLRKANDSVLRSVKAVEGLANVRSSLSADRPQVSVHVNQAKATAAGVDPSTISQYLTLVFNGFPVGQVPTAEGSLPATLGLPGFALPPLPGAAVELIKRLPLPTANGMVPIGAIATVTEVATPVQVTHVDGKRTATVTATVVNNNIGAAATDVDKALAKVDLPPGASWEIAGAAEQTSDVFRTMSIAMVIAVMIVYIIMVATFRSLLNPLILLVSIPFAAVGAVVLLLITGTSLGMPSMVGLLMLIGIVVTNAIVLLDLVEQFRRQGMDARAAVIEGGRRRLRPILMTAVATILALLPMALGLGNGAFLSTPLAVVVIGGLLSSTLLTLIIVPVLYVTLDRLRGTRRRRDSAPGATAAADSNLDVADASEA